MSEVTHVILSEHIMRLRMTAAALYDTGVASGLKPQDIQKEIEPVTRALSELISNATKKDVAGLAIAVKRIENQARCYMKDAEYLQKKAQDDMYHVEIMKKCMAMRMKEQNITQLQDHGFMVTMDPKTEAVTFR